MLTARKLTGNFPDYERVLPKSFAGRVTINVQELRGALDRARVLADSARRVTFGIGDGGLSISSGVAGDSETAETVPAEIGVNGGYVTDFLAAVDTATAVLSYESAKSAMQFTPAGEDGGDYRYVVMPMRI